MEDDKNPTGCTCKIEEVGDDIPWVAPRPPPPETFTISTVGCISNIMMHEMNGMTFPN